ncbi:hypothetical protein [Paracoccus actinidiae]|uniref:hypothetical protein n=1 Tax=Paracoccus actinidiae TaxID=3064531 RepID=UPI0027D32765|nr:hypothetical protein [Paracoccus sp. M09]
MTKQILYIDSGYHTIDRTALQSSRQIEGLACRAKLVKRLALARTGPLAINALRDTVKGDDTHLLLMSHIDSASIWLELREIVCTGDLLIFAEDEIGEIPKAGLLGQSAQPGEAKAGNPRKGKDQGDTAKLGYPEHTIPLHWLSSIGPRVPSFRRMRIVVEAIGSKNSLTHFFGRHLSPASP